MWFKKKMEQPEQVKCHTCKHYIDRSDAQEVKIERDARYTYSGRSLAYYCPMHKVPYDIVSQGMYETVSRYFKRIPEHLEEVSKEGDPIKKTE